jgi:prepilin-type N-terminal cleavage/methylation domain-containing protein/prepilin-type processing-associated H-X9-DG protein
MPYGVVRPSIFPRGCPKGFTLIELLVATGIIGILVAILVPTISGVRRSSRDLACTSNMRQVATALIAYAGMNGGAFPVNSGADGLFWYLEPVLGPHLTSPELLGRSGAVPVGAHAIAGLAGGVFRCPNDLDDASRSYSMNLYASGGVSPTVRARLDSDYPPGQLFRLGVNQSSRTLLLMESWSELPVSTSTPIVHVAQAIVGLNGTPGERFGGGRGVHWTTPPDATTGRFLTRSSQIAFDRHRNRRAENALPREAPRGRAAFAFVDGHVEFLTAEDLVNSAGASRFVARWSPIDEQLEARAVAPPSPGKHN